MEKLKRSAIILKFFDSKKNEIRLIHFHIHEKIRTGDRFIKSLMIPSKFIDSDLEYRKVF